MTQVKLLEKARDAYLKAHPNATVADFAATVLGRSRSTVWRWVEGHTPIPPAVVTRLRAYLTSPTE